MSPAARKCTPEPMTTDAIDASNARRKFTTPQSSAHSSSQRARRWGVSLASRQTTTDRNKQVRGALQI
ncbi:hypothetical protein PC123_g25112 [Phytophthora cactorum]|nr:hypothetical protein PC123_g25112 [Phytophthora cactorum]